MAKYRKKPVVIEAFLYNSNFSDATGDVPAWFVEALVKRTILPYEDHLTIKTLEGDHRADPGDYIIQGVKGELYPCKPDIFLLTYERVSS